MQATRTNTWDESFYKDSIVHMVYKTTAGFREAEHLEFNAISASTTGHLFLDSRYSDQSGADSDANARIPRTYGSIFQEKFRFCLENR